MATPRADGLVGGAFYNLASQCLTPLVALGEGRGAASKAVVQAKLSSQLKSSAVRTTQLSKRKLSVGRAGFCCKAAAAFFLGGGLLLERKRPVLIALF